MRLTECYISRSQAPGTSDLWIAASGMTAAQRTSKASSRCTCRSCRGPAHCSRQLGKDVHDQGGSKTGVPFRLSALPPPPTPIPTLFRLSKVICVTVCPLAPRPPSPPPLPVLFALLETRHTLDAVVAFWPHPHTKQSKSLCRLAFAELVS